MECDLYLVRDIKRRWVITFTLQKLFETFEELGTTDAKE